jgi:hypothetical protein
VGIRFFSHTTALKCMAKFCKALRAPTIFSRWFSRPPALTDSTEEPNSCFFVAPQMPFVEQWV